MRKFFALLFALVLAVSAVGYSVAFADEQLPPPPDNRTDCTWVPPTTTVIHHDLVPAGGWVDTTYKTVCIDVPATYKQVVDVPAHDTYSCPTGYHLQNDGNEGQQCHWTGHDRPHGTPEHVSPTVTHVDATYKTVVDVPAHQDCHQEIDVPGHYTTAEIPAYDETITNEDGHWDCPDVTPVVTTNLPDTGGAGQCPTAYDKGWQKYIFNLTIGRDRRGHYHLIRCWNGRNFNPDRNDKGNLVNHGE